MAMKESRRWGQGYSVLAINLLNLALLFLILNGISYILLQTGRPVEDEIQRKDVRSWLDHWDKSLLAKLYPTRSYEQIVEILANQAAVNPVYYPFYQFRYPEYHSSTFNIEAAGYRTIGSKQGSWPPSPDALVVFVFGGSTAMGAGAPDEDTVARFLQKELQSSFKNKKVHVYNFGTSAYQSTQEVIRFQILLQGRFIPNYAVFLDGLNDLIIWSGEPALTPMLRQAAAVYQDSFTNDTPRYHLKRLFYRLPLVEYASSLANGTRSPSPFPQVNLSEAEVNDVKSIDVSVERYLSNIKIARSVAREFGVTPVFAWQPISMYAYPFEPEAMKMLSGMEAGHHYALRAKHGYQRVVAMHKQTLMQQPDFLWCADIQKDVREMLYVDHVHYNAAGASLVAKCIAKQILSRNAAE